MFDVGVAVSLRVPDQVQRATRPQVLPVRHLLADHDGVRVGRVEEAPADLDSLLANAEAAAVAEKPDEGAETTKSA